MADGSELLKELHRIVNEAIRTQAEGTDQAEGIRVDLSRLDFDKLRKEFAKKKSLPRPPFTDEEPETLANRLHGFVWQRSESGALFSAAA